MHPFSANVHTKGTRIYLCKRLTEIVHDTKDKRFYIIENSLFLQNSDPSGNYSESASYCFITLLSYKCSYFFSFQYFLTLASHCFFFSSSFIIFRQFVNALRLCNLRSKNCYYYPDVSISNKMGA